MRNSELQRATWASRVNEIEMSRFYGWSLLLCQLKSTLFSKLVNSSIVKQIKVFLSYLINRRGCILPRRTKAT